MYAGANLSVEVQLPDNTEDAQAEAKAIIKAALETDDRIKVAVLALTETLIER